MITLWRASWDEVGGYTDPTKVNAAFPAQLLSLVFDRETVQDPETTVLKTEVLSGGNGVALIGQFGREKDFAVVYAESVQQAERELGFIVTREFGVEEEDAPDLSGSDAEPGRGNG